ncbi:MAG: FkbM family methyltransferase [Clostridia bacterium]|nr:FkbM family methyltransferase [Clostridia bacterium]
MIENILNVCDLWTFLKNSAKPILLYGMGDGADKVIAACVSKGIEISGVFASDGFSKNKIFHGFEVTDYTTAKRNFGDFIVLMSFASSREEVIDNVLKIAGESELYCPDVPVFGEGLFDSDFVRENFEKFRFVYERLSDELSKKNYVNLILGKLTGNIKYLLDAETSVSEAYESIIKPGKDSHYVDIGAYTGDTIREYLGFAKNVSRITAFEPDIKNYSKLVKFAEESGISTAHFHNVAAWDKKETLTFYSRSGRNSAGTTSHKNVKSIEIQADAADKYIDEKADFINIDAEGSDRNVLLGLKETIKNYSPAVSCAIYHRNEDFFDIPMLLFELYGECELYVRHFRYFPAWDTNIYAKPIQRHGETK